MRWVFIFAGLVYSQSPMDAFKFDHPPGSASYEMLKIETDARTIGMGGGGVALPGNAHAATEVNPASAALDSFKLYASHGYPFRETGSMISGLTWNIPMLSHRFLLHYRYLGYDDIRGFSDTDEPEGSYSAHTYKIQSGVAGEFHKIAWGMLFSFVENNIAYAKYFTAIVDAGIQYHFFAGLRVGASVNNGMLWTSDAINAGNDDPFPPSVVRAGFSYSHEVSGSFDVTATVDGKTRNDEKMHLPMGLEVVFRDLLSIRAGYPVLREEGSYTFGTGLKWNYFKFDYGMALHESLSAGHFWTLGLLF